MIDPPTIVYELAERTQAIAAGGLEVVQQMVGQLGIAQSINRGCPVFKLRLPYHPLLVTLANTREVLYVENRAGNRPSHEHAAGYFDRAVQLCREAGFRKVRLQGNTDFSQTTHLDRWHQEHVEFVFGMDAMKSLVKIAENLPDAAWEELQRKPKTVNKTGNKTGKTRARRPNYKEQFVVKKVAIRRASSRKAKRWERWQRR